MADVPLTRPTAPTAPIAATDQRASDPRFARRYARRRAELAAEDEDEPHDLPPSVLVTDPAQDLLEALDRLRVTNAVRPAELEYAKALRALKAYQDPTTDFYRPESVPPAAPPA